MHVLDHSEKTFIAVPRARSAERRKDGPGPDDDIKHNKNSRYQMQTEESVVKKIKSDEREGR